MNGVFDYLSGGIMIKPNICDMWISMDGNIYKCRAMTYSVA